MTGVTKAPVAEVGVTTAGGSVAVGVGAGEVNTGLITSGCVGG